MGIPVFVVSLLMVGTIGAIVLTPRDVLRSSVVPPPAQAPVLLDAAVTPEPVLPPVAPAAPEVQVASMTVGVTPIAAEEPVVVLALPPPEPPIAAGGDLRRTTDKLNMRLQPDQHSELVVTLPRGTEVTVTETSGTWARVTTGEGVTGWMSQNFLVALD